MLVNKGLYALTGIVIVGAVAFAGHWIFEPTATVGKEAEPSRVAATSEVVKSRVPSSRHARPEDVSDGFESFMSAARTLARLPWTAERTDPAHDVTAAHSPDSATGDARLAAAIATDNATSDMGSRQVAAGGGSVPAVATATAAPQLAPASAARPSTGPHVSEVSFSTDEGSACHARVREFRLVAVPDLHVCVALTGLSGKYVGKLTFLLADGNVYQNMVVPFITADMPMSTDPNIQVDGRTVQAKRAGWGANGVTFLTATLPVSGTFITQYTLGGVWTVQVALDGQQLGRDNFVLLTD